MENKKIERINALYKFSKERELTAEEKAEQQVLRREYIESYKAGLKNVLQNTYIKNEDGTIEKLESKNKK